MNPEWQHLMYDWEKTEQRLRALPAAAAAERASLEASLAEIRQRIDALVQEGQSRRRPVADKLTVAAIKLRP